MTIYTTMTPRPNSKKTSPAIRAISSPRRPTRVRDVFAIRLLDSSYAYGQRLDQYMLRCFDLNTSQPESNIDTITSRDTIFAVTAFRFAFSTWEKIGAAPVPVPFPIELRQFRQDRSNPLSCIIIEADGSERDATLAECIEANLERESVWDAPHVEERLLAHFRGTKSSIVERAKLIIPPGR